MNRNLTGRADLLRALVSAVPHLDSAMAELLGYREEPRIELTPPAAFAEPEPQAGSSAQAVTVYVPAQVPFWRLATFAAVAAIPSPLPLPDVDGPIWRGRPAVMPAEPGLASHRTVLTQLRSRAAVRRESRDINVEAVVERLGNGRLLDRLPYRQRRAWGTSMCLVTDRARRLTPYWRDQDDLVVFLKRLYLPEGWTEAWIDGNTPRPFVYWPEAQYGQDVSPAPGSIVLVLGDLGCLARQGESVRGFWRRWGRQLREQGTAAIALVPTRVEAIPSDLTAVWTIIPWGSAAGAGSDTASSSSADTVQRLLTLLSPTVRVEPGLLRAVRCLLPEGRRDPGLEARVWQDPAIASPHSEAASWVPEQRRAYLKHFAEQPEREAALAEVRSWRATLSPALWFEEIIGLDAQARTLINAADWQDAVRYLTRLADSLEQTKQLPVDTAAWIVGFAERLPETVKDAPRIQRAVQRLYELVRQRAAAIQAPGWYDPALKPSPDLPTRQVELWQQADRLAVRAVPPSSLAASFSTPRGSPLGVVHTANGEIMIASGAEVLERNDFWRNGQAPLWAQDYGWDEFGAWATFRVGEVEQRLRWISPGQFVMGSPEDEEGRYDDEGPRHEVQLTRGFWLFDSPCTQALWQEVMGENPSRFKGANRPVEQVSWDDCQEFIAKLNEQSPGLALRLPSEAEWEYACRARTDTARYADKLDAIAWYDKNSGSETHAVKQKQPNAWGLYDMLGNVLEWCHDGQREYTTARQVDPLGPTTKNARRVLRGGVWDGLAQNVRSAYRIAYDPGVRGDYFGFRCASSGEHQPVSERPTWSAAQRKAEPAQTATRRPPALLLDLSQRSSVTIEMPDDASFSVHTDRDHLQVVRETKPEWASEIGRDQCGLWAAFEVAGVRQQLRWIPPGRFWMGSPDGEEGRSDSEGPRHEVQLTHGFWLFDTPCTQALWQAVMKNNPSRFKSKGNNERPVEQVSWQDCQRFLTALNAQVPGLALTLPSEAEWEYACRAGTTTARYAEDLNAIAWYRERETQPVKQKQANAWGLYDMLGNVLEWCHDGQRKYESDIAIDPLGPTTKNAHRVRRGGFWFVYAQLVRSAHRFASAPGLRFDFFGFRCASSGVVSRLASEPRGDGQRQGAREGGARADRRRPVRRGEPQT